MKTLHLVEVQRAGRATAIRAVRDALIAAGLDRETALNNADEAASRWLGNGRPVPLVRDTAEVVAAAVVAFEAAAKGSAQVVVGEADPDELVKTPAAEPPTEGWQPSAEGAKTAIMLMAMVQGNGTAAWIWAQRLRDSMGGSEVMGEVVKTLEATFGTADNPLASER